MGWGGAAGDIDDLIRKMGATAYYPELFAWAFGDPAITEPRMQQAQPTSARALSNAISKMKCRTSLPN